MSAPATANAVPNRCLLLKPNETAAALAISPRLLWTITQQGELPCVRIGRAVRYDPDDLRAWIERQKAKGGERAGSDIST